MEVFNILGQRVATLIDNRMDGGWHEVVFNAKGFSSGIYFYTVTTPAFVQSRKMLLLK